MKTSQHTYSLTIAIKTFHLELGVKIKLLVQAKKFALDLVKF